MGNEAAEREALMVEIRTGFGFTFRDFEIKPEGKLYKATRLHRCPQELESISAGSVNELLEAIDSYWQGREQEIRTGEPNLY